MSQLATRLQNQQKRTVVVCDDDRQIVRLIQVNLERQGHRVIPCHDGESALRAVLDEVPDMLILDVVMPHMDGYDVLRRLKMDRDTADLPVVMLSAKSQDDDVLKGYRSGVDLYLTKPFNSDEIVKFVGRN